MRPPIFFLAALLFSATAFGAVEFVAVPTPGNGKLSDALTDEAGAIHLVYQKGADVFYAKSSDDGATFSTPLRVNSATGPAAGGMFRGPALALGKGGTVHVIWYPDQAKLPAKADWGVRYARLDAGATAFTAEQNIGRRPSDNYSLAADASGNVAVVWTAGALTIARSRDNGATFQPAENIPGADPCECCATRAVFTAQGRLSVLYRDKKDNDRVMSIADVPATGTASHWKLSDQTWPIKACPMTGSFITRAATGLLAAWENTGNVYFGLVKTGSPATATMVGRGKYPVALPASATGTGIAWKTGRTLNWKSFDTNGASTSGSMETPNADRFGAVVTKSGKVLLFE